MGLKDIFKPRPRQSGPIDAWQRHRAWVEAEEAKALASPTVGDRPSDFPDDFSVRFERYERTMGSRAKPVVERGFEAVEARTGEPLEDDDDWLRYSGVVVFTLDDKSLRRIDLQAESFDPGMNVAIHSAYDPARADDYLYWVKEPEGRRRAGHARRADERRIWPIAFPMGAGGEKRSPVDAYVLAERRSLAGGNERCGLRIAILKPGVHPLARSQLARNR